MKFKKPELLPERHFVVEYYWSLDGGDYCEKFQVHVFGRCIYERDYFNKPKDVTLYIEDFYEYLRNVGIEKPVYIPFEPSNLDRK